MMRIEANTLKSAIAAELISYHIPVDDSNFIADTFIQADLRGYPHQGCMRLLQLIQGVQNGNIKTEFNIEIVKNSEIVTVIDGKGSIGQLVARKAIEISVEKARQFGVGISGVINASHVGSLSIFTEMAAQSDCLCLGMCTSSPAVSFNGGANKILGTNPLAYSIPAAAGPITADFSTSKVSRGKILEKLERGEAMPLGWCVDKHGHPTTDPNVIHQGGSLLPFDTGAKASMLSLIISVLAGPLIGGVNNTEVMGTRTMEVPSNKGDLFITLHIPHFTGWADFSNKMQELKGIIERDSSSFHIPGSRSTANHHRNSALGIDIEENLFRVISKHLRGLNNANDK